MKERWRPEMAATACFEGLSQDLWEPIPTGRSYCIQTTMNLRTFTASRPPPRGRFALPAALALVLLSLVGGAGKAAAGVGDYPTTLYLSGAASTNVPGASNTLVTAVGPGQPAMMPTAVATVAAGLLNGTYSYAYTRVDPTGGETAVSPTSLNVSAALKSVTVGNLPTGPGVTVRIYRKGATGIFRLVAEWPNNASPTQIDNMDDATANTKAILPQAQNKQVGGATSWYEFAPGPSLAPGAFSTALASPLFAAGHGWVVDAPGRVSIPSGNWTFTNNIKGTAGGINVAHLVIGMWKVDDSGAVVGSPIIDPTGVGENTVANIATAAGTAAAIVTTINVGAAITLAAGEHLYVQFWRHQTAGLSSTLTTFYAYDGVTKIVLPAAANGFANVPVLGAIAARVNTTPQLSTTFADPDAGDTGTISFQLCTDPTCTTVAQTYTSASGLANPTTVNWTPTALVDGTYYWRASAQDSFAGNPVQWSAISSFVVDTVKPTTPSLGSPAAAVRVNAIPQLSSVFSDPDAGDTGALTFQLCTNASCTMGVTPFTSATVGSGSTVNWTPAGPLADGTYYWRARAQDAAGNQSVWSASRSFTLDTTAPTATLGAVTALVNTIPQLSAAFTDPEGSDTGTLSFQLCDNSTCTGTVIPYTSGIVGSGSTGTWTPTGLADGTYYVRVSAQDAAGNQTAPLWSAVTSFRLDATAPGAPALGAVAARTATTPLLSATYSDNASTGTLTVQLCTNGTCTSVAQSTSSSSGLAIGATFNWTPTALADGTYYWRARAQDAAGNLSSWSATPSFVVDTVAPNTPTLTAPAASSRVNTTQVTATFTDPDAGDSGTLSFQLCSDAACSSVVASSTSATVTAGSSANWTPAGIADGVYYWRVRAQDAAGNQSAWSATRSFTLDTNAPSTPALGAPADTAFLATTSALSATFANSDAGDSGSVLFQICTDSLCSTVVVSGSSPTGLANGATGTWTPGALSGGDYYWRAAARDAAGNQSAWSATRSFTLDKTPPAVPTVTATGAATRTRVIPSFSATYDDPGAATGGSLTFQLCHTSSCSAPFTAWTNGSVPNGTAAGWAPVDLPDGTYYARVRAEDTAGNQSAWSVSIVFTLDRTPPPAPAISGAGVVRVRTAPVLSARLDDPDNPAGTGRMFIELCVDAACTNVFSTGFSAVVTVGSVAGWQSPPLPDGTYYWRAQVEDSLANLSAPSAPRAFIIDTVAPNVPQMIGPGDGTLVKQALLTGRFGSSDASDGGTVTFEVCANAACTTVLGRGNSASIAAGLVVSGVSSGVSAGATVTWTADLPDGAYFWRTRAQDAAGNTSDWSAAQSFTLDRTPPGKPLAFSAAAKGRTLTLRWRPPTVGRASVVGYALLVNGRRIQTLDAKTLTVRVQLQVRDRRSFAIAAVDRAGNVGAPNVAFLPPAQPVVKQARRK